MKRNTRAWRCGALLTLIASGGLSTEADATDVKGSVRAVGEAKPTPESGVRPAYWQEWNGFIEPKKPQADLTREVAVVLIGASPTRDAATVVLKDGQLTPSTLVMQVGTSLRIRNEDDFGHQLYADGLKAFDAVETGAGQGRQVQIGQTGAFAVRDALAPHVRGTLHVLAKLSAVATLQDDGTFVFPEVPPGDYTVKVFRGATEVSSAPLSVGDLREVVIDPINIDLRSGK